MENADFKQFVRDPHTPIPTNINDMLFDPFDLNADPGVLDDLDPDINFYNIQANNITSSCKFLQINQLNKEILKLPTSSNISAMHLNIRSLPQKL
jgi:hypothetical protein